MSNALEEVKRQLKEKVDGRVMVRKNSNRYSVYFDTPTPRNKEIIREILEVHGYTAYNFMIMGGSYGYVISFNPPKV